MNGRERSSYASRCLRLSPPCPKQRHEGAKRRAGNDRIPRDYGEIDTYDIKAAADVLAHFASFAIVGVDRKAVNGAKERVREAIKNSGLNCPLL